MFYHIQHLCPRRDIDMGRCGFSIQLWPAWKDTVAASDMTQEKANTAIEKLGRHWLDGCGYGDKYDPDNNDPMADWEARMAGKPRKLGPNARHLYETYSIRVHWGEWGPEHITVPGDACGLDLDRGLGAPRGGMTLQPHNIDNTRQVLLLLVVFTWFAEGLVLDAQIKERQCKKL